MHPFTVIIGEHISHIVTQFSTLGLAEADACLCALFLLLDIVEHLGQRHFLVIGIHCNVCQRNDLVGREYGQALRFCL